MAEDEVTPAVLREIRRTIEAIHSDVGKLERSVTRLAEAIDAEYRVRDRLEALQREHDKEAQDDVEEKLEDLQQRVEGLGSYLRDLPERQLQLIEKKIYELRTARWEAQQAGVHREVTPAYGTQLQLQQQQYREQTGKIAVAAPDQSDDVSLTPAQQRGLVRGAKAVWKWGRWGLIPAGGLSTLKVIWDAIRHATGH